MNDDDRAGEFGPIYLPALQRIRDLWLELEPLVDTTAYDDVSALIESVTSKYGEMSVIKASIELQEHKEQSRGVPLVLARIRLVTDRGYFTAEGQGYGASHTLRLAANAVERQLLKGKTYGQSKKQSDAEAHEHLYGWWLGG